MYYDIWIFVNTVPFVAAEPIALKTQVCRWKNDRKMLGFAIDRDLSSTYNGIKLTGFMGQGSRRLIAIFG